MSDPTTDNPMLDMRVKRIQTLLRLEHELGRINGLETLTSSQEHRKTITGLWQAIQRDLAPIGQAIKDLPQHPDLKTIQWAQSVLAHRDLAFMELDTTGLEDQDQIIRFTLMNSNEQILEDLYIKSSQPISSEASRINGITDETLATKGVDANEAWERMQAAIIGRYVISWSQKWDLDQLDKMVARHNLDPFMLIGEDLQRRCTQYYNGEYYLNLVKLSERVGYEMPDPPEQTSIHRCTAQLRVTLAIAQATTDVRPPRPARTTASEPETATSSQDDGLGDLDDHPF